MATDRIVQIELNSQHYRHAYRSWLATCAGVILATLTGTGRAAAPQPPTLPQDLSARIWASGEQLANPVAIAESRAGKVYVAEAHRKNTGVWGVTFSRWWAMEDYQGRTMADREAMYERWNHVIPDAQLREKTDIVRVLEDSDRNGTADRSEVFFDNLNHPLDGNAAGILAIDETVLLTSIPHLWQLRDTNGDQKADVSQQMLTGFGVRVGVHGHDLHGLIQGPDGRIYFTVGDRGYDVTSLEGKRFHESHRGAVFRCRPDGSQLEVFHFGLRNPQELAFNDYGDLFTVDNNMSGGDECRILHLLEGADSAWDACYQLSGHFRDETSRPDHPKPIWFTEKLWSRPVKGQPRWHNPAVDQLSRGPGGLAFYPGTGLSSQYKDHFFLADFVGSQANSGILSFKLAPQGAGYRLETSEQFAWNILATDLEFAAGGGLYIADWIAGWTGTGAGRIWKIESKHPSATNDETASLLQSNKTFEEAPESELRALLGHADRRVRTRAQFELASRGKLGLKAFSQEIRSSQSTLPQIHALWGIGQLAAEWSDDTPLANPVILALKSPDAEVRAQAAKVMADFDLPREKYQALLPILTSDSPRTTYHALQTATKKQLKTAIPSVIAGVQRGWLGDPALRHACVSYLSSNLSSRSLAELHTHSSPDLRAAALLALRRLKSPDIKAFLNDAAPEVTFECIRAIHDLPITQIQGELAALLPSKFQHASAKLPVPIAHRILNANFRLGQSKHAKGIAEVAASASINPELRLEALRSLRQWNDPSDYDRVTWHLRPHRVPRESKIGPAIEAPLKRAFSSLLTSSRNSQESLHSNLLATLADVLVQYELIDRETAEAAVQRSDLPLTARIAFLNFLLNQQTLTSDAATELLSDNEPALQAIAAVLLAERNEPSGWTYIENVLRNNDSPRIQSILPQLSRLPSKQRAPLLKLALQRASAESLPEATWLELYELAESTTEVHAEFEKFKTTQLSSGRFGPKRLALSGGDPTKGESLFRYHAAQCIRCHQIGGFGGSAGPDLSKIGSTLSGEEILEALLSPNQRIAPGFGTTTLDLNNGDVATGIIVEETESSIRLRSQNRQEIQIPKQTIAFRSSQQSSMPPMGDILNARQLRDLVAYLAEQK